MRTDLHTSKLQAGDVLLCRGNTTGVSLSALIRSEISAATSSPYTHAAIYLGNNEVADARVLQGICVRQLTELLTESVYIAVLRQPDVWSPDRISKLKSFICRLVEMGAKYNRAPFNGYILEPALNRKLLWEGRQLDYYKTVVDQIEALFSGNTPPSPDDPYRRYFCSELVVAAFKVCGYMGEGVDIIYNPAYLAPGDLVKDHTFGFLVGYMAKGSTFDVADDDPLIGTSLVSEVPPWTVYAP